MNIRSARIIIYSLIFLLIGIYCYAKKVERNSRYSVVFYKLAQECGDRCTRAKQKYYYKKAFYHDSNNSNAYYQLAVMLEQDGSHEEAFKYYRKVTRLDPENAEAYFKAGVGYFKIRELEYAKRCLLRAAKIRSLWGYSEPHHYLGLIYAIEKDYEKAIWHYKRCVGVKNEYCAESYLGMRNAFYSWGNTSNALDDVKKLRLLAKRKLALELEQFILKGQYPQNPLRIDLTK